MYCFIRIGTRAQWDSMRIVDRQFSLFVQGEIRPSFRVWDLTMSQTWWMDPLLFHKMRKICAKRNKQQIIQGLPCTTKLSSLPLRGLVSWWKQFWFFLLFRYRVYVSEYRRFVKFWKLMPISHCCIHRVPHNMADSSPILYFLVEVFVWLVWLIWISIVKWPMIFPLWN